ncbi:IPT/TIG domain-containing protein [Prevotella sp.]|uniref:IPT/TIG domain-containing protein n=1 Tax=Prevotella sp. TaxID=59823 RepID=UPI002F95C8D7
MKKHYNIVTLLVIALMGLSLVSCSNDDLNTDQYGKEISLLSFGPCPILRGGTLHLLGSHLDQVTEIDLPGADPITQFEVLSSGEHSEITIQVPAEKCESGKIILKTAKGGTIESVSPITYREDIVVKDFYVGANTSNKAGNVGDVVTITGDYLNLFKAVIFADKDTVKAEQFVAHDRYTIKVAITKGAKTGVFKLSDLAETPNEIETEKALTVNLPTVTSLSNDKPKAGQSITVNGKSLNQIKGVTLKGATIEEKDLKKSADGTKVTFVVPNTANDGEVQLLTYSEVSIPAGSITTVVPTELTATPAPVKNEATITINGKDLDLVTTISYPNAEGTVKTVAANKVTSVVPATAQEGDITLGLANGKTVTVAYTLVKPSVTSFTPNTIVAGNKVMMRGTNLDLVESVTFPGDADIMAAKEETRITATAIGTLIPTAAYGKGCTLNLKNGTSVKVDGLTINAATDPALNEEKVEAVVGEYVTVQGKNFNNVESIYIGDTKITKVKSRSDNSLTFQVPTTLTTGVAQPFTMIGPDGTRYNVGQFTPLSAEKTIWTGSFNNAGWAGNQDLAWGAFDWSTAKAGQVLTFYVEGNDPAAGWACISLRYGDGWGNMPNDQINLTGSSTVATYTLTPEALDLLINKNGLVITGDGVTIKKVTLK